MNKGKISFPVLIFSILIIVVIGVVLIPILSNGNDKNFVYYDNIVISSVTSNKNMLTISAGKFKYGDVNMDGIINDLDTDLINDIINNQEENFDTNYKILADVNKDNVVDNNDLILVKNLLHENNNKYTYNVKTRNIRYCVNEIDDSTDCNWSRNKEFDVKYDKNYYVYVKDDKEDKEDNVIKYETVVKVKDYSKFKID